MLNIQDISSSLVRSGEGIWRSPALSSVSYPENGNKLCYTVEDNSFWFIHRNNCIAAASKKFEPKGTIMDVGGGNGFVTRMLNQLNIESILLEPGINGITNAKERGINTIIHSTFEDAGFFDKSLPAVGLFDVLEHVENDMEFLKLIHRKLYSNGKLYITVPAYCQLWSYHDIHAQHFRRYSRKQLCSTLESAGFNVEYITFFFSILIFPILLFRTLPYKLGLPKKTVTDDTRSREHIPNKFIFNIVGKLLAQETKALCKGYQIPFGSSLLVVAKAST